MKVTVKYFASIREALGPGETVDVGNDCTVGQLRDELIGRSPAHADSLARGKALRAALNQSLCDDAAVVTEHAEVAFFPPVTGG